MAALCFGTLTVNVELAPADPGVTVAGEKITVAPGGRLPRMLLWLLITLTSIGVVTGCGAGGYFSEPEKTYVITVTGTSGSVVHTTTATLTVE